jgi:hypothetical protein
MTIPQLQQHLADRAQAFVTFAEPLSDEQFFAALEGDKWSVAEHLQHLYLTARPVARVMGGPRAFLAQFGQANQPSRSYEQLQAAYKNGLAATGIKAPANMSARPDDLTDRAALVERYAQAHQAVADSLANWTEEELETCQIPHPAIGMLTAREMAYFTAFHVDHHLEPTKARVSS